MASRATAARKRREERSASSFVTDRDGSITPDVQLTILLVLVARRWRSLLDEKLRPSGQSSARMEALSAILNSPERSAQVDIARRLRIEGPTLTRMLDTLEKDGLVERLPDPGDRRSKQLQVTEEGQAALAEILAVAETYRARLLAGIGEEEREAATRLLACLLDRLDTGLPDSEPPA